MLLDVVGHGAGVSRISKLAYGHVNDHVGIADQSALADALNESIGKIGEGGFATALLLSYLPSSGALVISNAGHPDPLIKRGEEERWRRVAAGEATLCTTPDREHLDVPLGALEGAGFNKTRLLVNPGDGVLLYSDGITEARDRDGKFLGEDGLIAILNDHLDEVERPDRMAASLREHLARDGFGTSADDSTAVFIRVRES